MLGHGRGKLTQSFLAAVRLALPENGPALRAHAKVGYQLRGIIRSFSLGLWCYVFPVHPVTQSGDAGVFQAKPRSLPLGGS